jgi:hypothetical protein
MSSHMNQPFNRLRMIGTVRNCLGGERHEGVGSGARDAAPQLRMPAMGADSPGVWIERPAGGVRKRRE